MTAQIPIEQVNKYNYPYKYHIYINEEIISEFNKPTHTYEHL